MLDIAERYDWSTFNIASVKEEFMVAYPDFVASWPRIERALTHRNAWKAGYMDLNEGPMDFVREWISLAQPAHCAWVGQDGTIHSFGFAQHDLFASVFLGETVGEIETRFARISEYTSGIRAATAAVTRPSKKMIDGVIKHVMEYPKYYKSFSMEID